MSAISIETKKISELTAASAAVDNDLLILRKSDGTGVKAISVANLRNIITGLLSDLDTTDKDSIVDAVNEVVAHVTEHAEWLDGLQELFDHFGIAGAGLANSIFVDEAVSDTILADKATEITAGTFEGLWVGQFVPDGSQKYRFSDFDYFLHCGDTETTRHHILTVPDKCMYTAKMNDSNVTTGAYVGSAMYTANLAAAITTITNKFGSAHLLTHKEYLKNAVTNGYESGAAWYDRIADLMTEEMVYGGKEFKNIIAGTNIPANYTISNSQLSSFRLNKALIRSRLLSDNSRMWYWLRDVVNAAYFAVVNGSGICDCLNASYAGGVRPAFPLI